MKNIVLVLCMLYLVVSCKNESKLEEDIAKIPMQVNIERFDKLFSKASLKDLPALKKEYPFMFSEKYTDSFWLARMRDTLQIRLFDEVEKVFPEINNMHHDIQSMFQHITYYFPEFKPPRVITTTSYIDYRNRIIVTDTIALISIDNYLGSDHEFYLGIQKYTKRELPLRLLPIN